MGGLIALAVICLLAVLPLGVTAAYDSEGVRAAIIAGPLRIGIIPAKRKKGQKKLDKQEKKKAAPAQKETAEQKKGGSVADFLPFAKLAMSFLNSLRKKLRVDRLYLKVVLAGGDPCDLAINYGKAWTALGNLWPHLESFVKIGKRDVAVMCDFEGEQTLISARVDITITLGRAVSLLVCYGIRFLREHLNLKNKRKGGATV